MAYISGKTGFVTAGGVNLGFRRWKIPVKTNKVKCPTWKSPQFVAWLVGQFDGTVQIEGPWDIGSTPLVLGGTYTWNLGLAPGVALTVVAFVEMLTPGNDLEDQPTLIVDLQPAVQIVAGVASSPFSISLVT